MTKRKRKSRSERWEDLTRTDVEAVLRSDFRLSLEGFWSWLANNGGVDGLSGAHTDVMEQAIGHFQSCTEQKSCRVCAVWTAVLMCWKAAGQQHHEMASTVEALSVLRRDIERLLDRLFDQEKGQYVEALRGLTEDVSGNRDLTLLPAFYREGFVHAPRRFLLSARLMQDEAAAMERAICRSLEPAVTAKLYGKDGELLRAQVSAHLKEAGFTYWEIAEVLSESETEHEIERRVRLEHGKGVSEEFLRTCVADARRDSRTKATGAISRRVRRYKAARRQILA
ncbi:MAG: hypothetical protein OXU20_38365 [Myxococcales bacterium]|nr:hypothetical protein [Myxococcales bacterium]